MSLKKAYLYLVSVISLIIAVVGAIMLINLALKAWVFTKADRNFYAVPCYSVSKVAPVNGSPEPCSLEEEANQRKMEDDNRTAQRQRDAAQAIAMLVIATPIWLYHWKMARKEV